MNRWMLLAEDNVLDADLLIRGMPVDPVRQHVIVARDGVEALDCLYRRAGFQGRETGHPAVVLLDLKMPKLGGLDVLRQIRADPDLKLLPVVILTSSKEEKDVTRCYQFGTNAYIVKPVDIHHFHSVASEIWRHWMEMNEPPPEGSAMAAFPSGDGQTADGGAPPGGANPSAAALTGRGAALR